MVIGAVVSVQLGSAAATTLFDQVGPAGAVLYRLLAAAIVLLAIWRPRPLGAGRDGLVLAVAFGVTLAGMNFCFYESLDRIPLGIAVTFEFVGPLLVGLFGSRRPRDLIWVGCAAAGVLLLTRPSGSASAAGIGFALLAGAFWGVYILLSARVGRVFPGGRGLALAMGVAALLMVIPGTASAGGDLIDPGARPGPGGRRGDRTARPAQACTRSLPATHGLQEPVRGSPPVRPPAGVAAWRTGCAESASQPASPGWAA